MHKNGLRLTSLIPVVLAAFAASSTAAAQGRRMEGPLEVSPVRFVLNTHWHGDHTGDWEVPAVPSN